MLTDSHCHLDFTCFDHMQDDLISNCLASGISHFINPAVQFHNWHKVIALSVHHPFITPALGLHPCFLQNHRPHHIDKLHHWITINNIKLIGEIGLDKRFLDNFEGQQFYFKQQLLVAKTLKKPIIIHSAKAHNEIIETLKADHFMFGGIIHAFSGSYNIAKTYCDLGFKLGIGSILHYPNSKLSQVIRRIGASHILLESDSPDMPLPDAENAINTPLSILKTFDLVTNILQQTPKRLKTTLQSNLDNIITPKTNTPVN
ncbi:TatD family hydrolase [Fastidiosibacter lacustris]|uniref:TatD family hydrolase n=1 Tax=Fastidiosibacter lacustris TaxID=2056695 RepID=UPI000E355375|nr:TatD family hydrolase [Fastidiosibacter lacustris]